MAKKVNPTSLCSSSNAVHCSLAVRSCREVVDYLQVLNSKKFWEASDSVEEEALFEVLGGAIREQVRVGDGGILQKELRHDLDDWDGGEVLVLSLSSLPHDVLLLL